MSSTDTIDEYEDALKADHYARATIRWSGPIIVFGWIVAVLAALFFLLGLLGTLFTIARNGSGADGSTIVGVAVEATAVLAVISLVVLVQASLLLIVGYYMRMRGHWIKFQVGRALADD